MCIHPPAQSLSAQLCVFQNEALSRRSNQMSKTPQMTPLIRTRMQNVATHCVFMCRVLESNIIQSSPSHLLRLNYHFTITVQQSLGISANAASIHHITLLCCFRCNFTNSPQVHLKFTRAAPSRSSTFSSSGETATSAHKHTPKTTTICFHFRFTSVITLDESTTPSTARVHKAINNHPSPSQDATQQSDQRISSAAVPSALWLLTLKGSFYFQPVMNELVGPGEGDELRSRCSRGTVINGVLPETSATWLSIIRWPEELRWGNAGLSCVARAAGGRRTPFEFFITVFCHYMIKNDSAAG